MTTATQADLPPLETYRGQRFRWWGHPRTPEMTLTEITGMVGTIANVVLQGDAEEVRREIPATMFRSELASRSLRPVVVEGTEVPPRPPAVGDLFQQARDWIAMDHPYPGLEDRNDHGLELVAAIALEIGCEATVPEGLSGARLKDAIAGALAGMLEPAKAQEPEKPKGKAPTSNEWYLPVKYAQAVREVLGTIDLDPASCEIANRTIQAAHYYTIETDGFDKPWPGRVYLNPPYNDGGSARWSARLVEQYEAGETTEAILLVNATTERGFFRALWRFPICFTDHRISFYGPEGEGSQPTHGNAFVYLGSNPERFREEYEQFGTVVVWQPEPQTFDELRAARDHHLAEADRLTARMRELHEAERAQVLAQLATLDQKAAEMGLSA